MHRNLFEREVATFLADVRDDALRLFDDRVRPEQCIDLAIQIAMSKAAKRALDRQALTGAARPALMG